MNKLFFIVLLAAFFSGCSSEEEDKTEEVAGVGSVSGFTTDNNTGAIISDVNVSIDSNHILSSTDGSYTLSNIPIGNNPITGSKLGYITHSGTVSITESNTTTYDIVLEESSCIQPYSGLVGWWTGDGNANDIVGSNNGLVMNGTTFSTGLVSNAFSFDGVDDFVTISDSTELNPGSFISVSAWVKFNASNDHQAIVSKFYGNYQAGPNDDSYLLMIVANNGGLYWHIMTTGGGGILITNPVDISDNQFHHIVGTYDGNLMRVYLDGQEIVSFSQNPGAVTGDVINSVGTPLLIGGGSNGNVDDWFANGLVDEVNIYNVALADSQILGLFDAGAAGICK